MVGATSKIHDVLIAHYGLPHIFPLTVHLKFSGSYGTKKSLSFTEFAKKKLIMLYPPLGIRKNIHPCYIVSLFSSYCMESIHHVFMCSSLTYMYLMNRVLNNIYIYVIFVCTFEVTYESSIESLLPTVE